MFPFWQERKKKPTSQSVYKTPNTDTIPGRLDKAQPLHGMQGLQERETIYGLITVIV